MGFSLNYVRYHDDFVIRQTISASITTGPLAGGSVVYSSLQFLSYATRYPDAQGRLDIQKHCRS